MNKIAKVLSVVLSATLALSVAVVLLVSAFAADAPKLSLNVVSEEGNTATVVVKLESGSFMAIDFQIKGTSDKIVKCTKIKDANDFRDFSDELKDNEGSAVTAYYSNTGKYSAAVTEPFSKAGGEVAVYTFEKASADKITNEDLTLVVNSCENSEGSATAVVVNNLPVAEEPTEAPTEEPTEAPTEEPTEAPTEEPTEAPTEEPTEAPTEEPTEAPTEEPTEAPTEEPTEAPTEEPTEAPTEEPTEAPTEEPTEAPTEEPTEAPTEEPTEAPAEDPTEAPAEDPTDAPADDATEAPASDAGNDAAAADGDVVNPKTGDSVTATAAIASLLAVSAAAVVVLRKKED